MIGVRLSVDWSRPVTHFGVGGPSVLLDPPEPFPRFPRLQIVGLVADDDGGRSLVVAVGNVHSFLGPSRAEVRRRAFMLASTIASSAHLETEDAVGEIVDWLTDMWVVAGGEGDLDPLAIDEQEQLWLAELERELVTAN
jgi:hypothetical protein